MSIGEIQDFFNWKRIIFWILLRVMSELERIKFLILKPHASSLTSFLCALLSFPVLKAHRSCRSSVTTCILTPWGFDIYCSFLEYKSYDSFTTFDFLFNCHLLNEAFPDHSVKRVQLFYYLLTCIILFHSPYHCLTWCSVFTYFLFLFFSH